jgi:tetratricopeptide (TPR) repeat protein
MLVGRHDEAEALVMEAVAVAGHAAGETPGQIAASQIALLRWQQGRLAELEGVFEAAVQRYPHVSGWRCALILSACEAGDLDKARAEFERLAAHDFTDLARDTFWTTATYYLAYACAELGDERRARRLYDMLLPYAHWFTSAGAATLFLGSEARALGCLAATMRSWEAAVGHFEDALSANARIGALPWLAFTQHDYARMLLTRAGVGDRERAIALLSQAHDTAGRLGMAQLLRTAQALLAREEAAHSPSEEVAPAVTGADPLPAAVSADTVFRREGEYWTLAYDGSVVRLRDTKGLRYIATLLRHPGTEMHARDLASEGTASGPEAAATPGSLGPLLDPQAKADYKQRLAVLGEELADAERCADGPRVARAQEEVDFLAQELAAAVGLGGRDREYGSANERARLMVTQRIKATLRKVDESHPRLGRHLRRCIKTGALCAYMPDPDHLITWSLSVPL